MNDKELFNSRIPSARRCKTCVHALSTISIGTYGVIERYAFGYCEKYDSKPNDVLLKDEECEYYERGTPGYEKD